ncbi:MAG: hypothetical protein ACRDA7_01280 [Metamycoplasmataceae bacterium]
MNLINDFLENYEKFENDKWYKNKDLFYIINENKNLSLEEKFNIKNDNQALKLFKDLLEPNGPWTKEKNILYLLLCYYFKIKQIELTEVNDFIDDPIDSFDIGNSLYKIVLKIREDKLLGETSYQERRKFNNNIKIKQNSNIFLINNDKLFSYIELKKLSTSDKKFSLIERREQLETMVKTIENFLKKDNDKFIQVEEKYFFDLITNEMIKKYRKSLSCFRHGHENAVKEINNYSDEDLDFLVNLGIVICIRLNFLKEKNKL